MLSINLPAGRRIKYAKIKNAPWKTERLLKLVSSEMDFTTWGTNKNTHVKLNKAEIKSPLAGIYIVMRKKGKPINYNCIYILYIRN